jgi:glycosyltransferase involved in cell wall biosynthesis
MSTNSQIHPLLKIAKRLRQLLRYQLTRIYVAIVPRFKPKLDKENLGVNFIGYAQGELGLGQAMRSMVFATLAASIPFVVRKFKASIPSKQSNDELNQYFSEHCQYPINIICVNPDTLHLLPSWINYSEWAKTYNIGYWFWELENFPKKWEYATNIVDEIWVATDYVASAMRKSGKKVVKIPFPLEFSMPPDSMNKEYFGINPNKFTYLSSFDFLSSIERKNPQGVIRAFQKAFPSGDDSVRLIIKTMYAGAHPKELKKIESVINGDLRIEIRDGYLAQEEMRGLIRSVDAYVSLHRAEGLGLGLAEAMYMGKPTIATGYSGNLEFMNETNSILVSYQLVQIGQSDYPNAEGGHWAEPKIVEATLAMRKVLEDSDFREKLGAQASLYMKRHHSYAIVASIIRDEFEQIGL